MHWFTGPILTKELRVASRRKRMYALRLAYLAVMALILVPVWASVSRYGSGYSGAGYDPTNAYRMADMGRTLVPVIVWIQFFAVQLVAMLTMSTSISDEISRRTLGALLTTPLNAWQLVIGKLTSRLVWCASLLAMSLPILALLTVFGGVAWSFVLMGLAMTLSTMLLVASVTMWFSISNRRPYVVFLETLLGVGVIYVVPIIIGVYIGVTYNVSEKTVFGAMATFHPVISLLVETEKAMYGRGWAIAGTAPWVCVLVNVALAALLVCWCVRIVRRASLAAAMGMSLSEFKKRNKQSMASAPVAMPALASPPLLPALHGGAPSVVPPPLPPVVAAVLRQAREAEEPPVSSVKSLSGNPVYWKDTVRRRIGTRGIVSAAVVMGLLLMVYAFVFHEYIKRGYVHHNVHMFFFAALGILGGLIAVVVSATGIPAEREARTWDMVLASPLTNGQIVLGKFLAALRRFWLAFVPLGLHVVVFVVLGSLRPVVLLHVAAVVVGMTAFIAALGVLMGTCVRRTTASLVLSLLVVLFLWAGAPLLALLAESNMGYRYRSERFSNSLLDVNPVTQLIVTAEGSASRQHYQMWKYYEPNVETYYWPGNPAGLAQTTQRIVYTTVGYGLLAAGALALANRRLRRVKE